MSTRKRGKHKRVLSEITPGTPRERPSKRGSYIPNVCNRYPLTAKSKGQPEQQVEKPLRLQDFELIKLIGRGGFGKVYVCKKKDTNEVVALKIIDKKLVWKKNKVRHIKNERDVLANNAGSFLNHLVYSFQDKHNLYLAMEYCPGGDLRKLLTNMGCLSESDAVLYMAEMIMATHQLHQLGYIHRDLKPDNFLIAADGHLRLTDFGLSKEGAGLPTARKYGESNQHTPLHDRRQRGSQAFSVVGSPDYMSPEVLNVDGGYSTEVDWWSLGCIFFEMVTGETPFCAETAEEVFDNIQHWSTTLPMAIDAYREYMSEEFIDLLQKFLNEPHLRWGDHNLSEIQNHPFFKGLDWTNLRAHNPFFVPKLEHEFDTSYFESVKDASQCSPPTCTEDDPCSPTILEPANASPPTYKVPLKCPQTAPRPPSLSRIRKHQSDRKKRPAADPMLEKENNPWGIIKMGKRCSGGLKTPTRASSPNRDILGFTFKRKRNTRQTTPVGAEPVRLNFDIA